MQRSLASGNAPVKMFTIKIIRVSFRSLRLPDIPALPTWIGCQKDDHARAPKGSDRALITWQAWSVFRPGRHEKTGVQQQASAPRTRRLSRPWLMCWLRRDLRRNFPPTPGREDRGNLAYPTDHASLIHPDMELGSACMRCTAIASSLSTPQTSCHRENQQRTTTREVLRYLLGAPVGRC